METKHNTKIKTDTKRKTNTKKDTDMETLEDPDLSGLENSISFKSIPWSRFAVVIVSTIMGIINAVLFGTGILEKFSETGSYFVLGGPTMFYPMSLFPLIFAGGILTFALLHTKKIEMQRTNIQGELKLLLNEKGVWKQQISVKQSQIDAFSLQNAH